ncbi:PWI domain [Popillia japonica]|uniref:PWI domain n=1 Tax=Popillia japonica TaxID=7064 RepID=A0AAW1MIA7_POPJA
MIIQDQDAFKTWLTSVLKPICEADPSALAKYVIALVKKDKSQEALRDSMINQLEVFLQAETVTFVDLLFKTLETQDYLEPVIPNANPPNPNVVKPENASPIKPHPKEIKPIIPVSELPSLSEAVNGSATRKDREENKRDIRKSDSRNDPNPEKEDNKPRRRSRHRSLSRNRSRSRSWDRIRRSRSREKSRERDQHRVDREKRERARPWRNKSPPRRSPPRSTSRSRSRSKDRKDPKDAKDNHSGAGTPTQDSNHGDMDLRLTNTTQSIQSVVVQQNSNDNRGPKRRCRDYDEKGYCMRGEMCPFDHGVDPVVLEDSTLSRVLTYAPNGAPVPDVAPNVLAPPIIGAAGHPMIHNMPPRPLPPEYNPQAPQMFHRGFRGPRPSLGPRVPPMNTFPPQPNMQRELIPVPVMDNQPADQFAPGYTRQPFINNPGGGPVQNVPDHDQDALFKKRPGFDFNRLGPRTKNPSNCSLELKKVPTGLNNITHLNNHFSKFGKILNIQVGYDGDPEAAIITFSSHAEANAAYRSTEAVLNNRFIKVFWHSNNNNNNEGKQENLPPRSVKDRLGIPQIVPPNSNKVLNLVQPKAETKPEEPDDAKQQKNVETVKEDKKAQVAAAIKKNQELLAAKEKRKKNQEEALKVSQNLRKRQQELLEKQLAQQKLLIGKMEKTPAGPQRDYLLRTIKKSQESIEAIRKVMVAQPVTPLKHQSAKKTKEEAQKEMLDAELDLITKQQEGADTSELQKKILELKAKTQISRGRGRGRRFPVNRHLLSKNNLVNPGLRTSMKVNRFQKHAIDHRPTRLLVSGYESDEKESVLSHFSQFGEIVDYVTDAATPSIVLNYKTRKEAEVAIIKGKHFQDRTLSVTWCNSAQLNNQLSGRSSSRTVLVSESDEDHLIDQGIIDEGDDLGPEISEEALLQDDEEEDEENENRSWRR